MTPVTKVYIKMTIFMFIFMLTILAVGPMIIFKDVISGFKRHRQCTVYNKLFNLIFTRID